MKVPVFEVTYFQTEKPNGYVVHEASDKPFKNFWISAGPFIVNNLIGALLLLPASIQFLAFETIGNNILGLISFWLGLSILMHAFPSLEDADIVVDSVLKNKNVNFCFKILSAPIIGIA